MAECSGSQLTVDEFPLETDAVNMSDWTNGKVSSDSDSDHQKRSDIVQTIIHNHSLDYLGGIVGSGWDVNERLSMPEQTMNRTCCGGPRFSKCYRQRTALGEAARQGWIEGVKILLDAGARCRTSGELENPITLALYNHDCPAEVIELLLQHGADPNDAQLKTNPLLQAIGNCRCSQNVRIVQLLLEHGADPNVSRKSFPFKEYLLSAAQQCQEFEVFSALFRILIKYGADINYRGPGILPLLHQIMFYSTGHHGFLQEQLDLFFLHGGNINMDGSRHGTALENVVRECRNNNNIRWLIRHGADTSSMKVTLQYDFLPDTPLILLQADMRVSYGVVTQLSNMEMALTSCLQDHSTDYKNIKKSMQEMWAQLEEAEDKELKRMQRNLNKTTFPQYLTQQMVDLQEFSDENLNVYPEVLWTNITDKRRKWKSVFDQIHTMLEFLSQTQSLQWYCHRCVQENLVSLQPSVVETLPIPARLKRYILCHEI